jgi:hypothetical protein
MNRNAASFIALLFTACSSIVTRAQIAEIRGLNGEATYTVGNSVAVSVRKGVSLPVGALVKTGRGAAVDIYLGPAYGTVRLTQNTVLSIDKLDATQTYLTLWDGSFVGWDAKVPANASFQVKLSRGVLGIVSGRYRVDSRSYLVLVEGLMVYAHVMPDNQLKPFTLQAPPAVYFSPVEGVKTAPAPLRREVELQGKGKLR